MIVKYIVESLRLLSCYGEDKWDSGRQETNQAAREGSPDECSDVGTDYLMYP